PCSMFRYRLLLVLVLLASILLLAAAPLFAQERVQPAKPQLKPYSLPPDKYERAVSYSHWQYALHFLGLFWTAGTLLAILIYGIAPRLRDWAEGASRARFLEAAMFIPALILAIDIPRLPLDFFGHWLNRHYDQSVQGWGSWLWDWTKAELIGFVIAIILGWILYGAIRRS